MCILHSRFLPAIMTISLGLATLQANAGDPEPDYSTRLLGDWNGLRTSLHERGLDVDIVYKFDALYKATGATPKGHFFWLDHLDVQLAADAGRLFDWPGTALLLHVVGNHGEKPAVESQRLPHGLDNIEVPDGSDSIKIFQAWIEKSLTPAFSAKFGLYAVDSEFYVTESTSVFIHPTYGPGAEFAGTGQNGPSVFPNSSLGLRLKYQSENGWYGQAAILDGVPGNPDHPRSTRIDFEDGDGALYVAELGHLAGPDAPRHHKAAVGLWRYSEPVDDLLVVDGNGDPVKRHSQGFYLLGEATVWVDHADPARRVLAFVRGGRNDGDTTQFSAAWSAGLVWEGVLPGSPDNQFGITLSSEHNTDKWQIANGSSVQHERALEVAYRSALNPWLSVEPFVQYLINHGSDPSENTSWWAGVRLEFNL